MNVRLWLGWPGRWLATLGRRERRLVVGGVLVVAVVLIETFAIEPGLEWLEGRRRFVAGRAETLAQMHRSAAEVTRLRAAGAGKGTVGGKEALIDESLLSLADRTAKEQGLGAALKRVEPEGEGRVRLWFDKASFEGLMAWLEGLATRHGARVENITLDREETPGLVRARVGLAWPERSGAARGAGR
ncbi:MAG: type II secretion system protein M [Magnetococcales bacterium]|nr:type II secretion system protein M [Magnetococcales bacterium]